MWGFSFCNLSYIDVGLAQFSNGRRDGKFCSAPILLIILLKYSQETQVKRCLFFLNPNGFTMIVEYFGRR